MGRSGFVVVVLVRPKEWEDKNANREPWKNGKPAEEREECTVNRVGIFPQFPANFTAKKASKLGTSTTRNSTCGKLLESLDLKENSWAICSHRSSLKKVGKVGSPGPPHICLNLSKNVVLETKATKPKLGKNVNGRLPLENGNFLALDQYSTHLQKNIRHGRGARK